jgi:hypothetical protein
VAVQYRQQVTRADGQVRTAIRSAKRGQVIELDPVEEARLDAYGALCPAGATLEDLRREQAANPLRKQYVEERQSVNAGFAGATGWTEARG